MPEKQSTYEELQKKVKELERAQVERKKAVETLNYRLKFENLIASISNCFLRYTPDDVDTPTDFALQKIGEFADVDRSYVFLLSDDGKSMDNTHEWCAEGIEPQMENLRGLPSESLPWWMDKLRKFETIHIPIVDDLPQEADTEKRLLQEQSILSLVVVPLVYAGSLVGFIGFDSVRRHTSWADEDIALLNIAGEILVSAIKKKKAEDTLEYERAQLLSIFDSIDESIYVTDPKTNEVLYCNKNLEQMFGKDLVGKVCYEEFQGLDHPCDFCTNEIIMRQKPEPYRWHYHNPSIDKDFQIIDRIITWPDGRDVRFEIAIDVTERKQAKQALQESEERFREMAELMPEIIYETDLELNLTYVNKCAFEQFGYTRQEFDEGLNGLDMLVPEARIGAQERVDKLIMGEDVGLIEYTALRKDGSTFPIMLQADVIYKDGDPVGLRGIIIDITQQKQLEDERTKAAKLESIGILAGGIAHDFNNILFGVLGNVSIAKMIAETENYESILELLTAAERAGRRATELTQQLLTFSKGGAPLKKTASVAGLIKESSEFALSGSNVTSRYDIQEGLWPCEIDEGQINQVINNLVINADQAMPEGGMIVIRAENVTVRRGNRLPLNEGRYAMITIEDQGVGIPKEQLSKIFDPYYTTKQKGSGLGLTTTYSIVKRHGGHITLESELGVGTTFYIYLPASCKQVEAKEGRKKKIAVTKGKILVMDDEQIIRDVVSRMLESIGHEVECTTNGTQALKIYRQATEYGKPFDAVILDLTIPGGMGGRETVKQLLKMDPDVKAIISSGYANNPVVADYRENGFSAVMSKPYRIEEMEEVLQKVLNKTGN